MSQFDPQYRRLDFVESAIHTLNVAHVPLPPPILMNQSSPFGKVRIACHHTPGIAQGPKVLRWVEAKSRNISPRSYHSVVKSSPMRLGAILHDS
jgi:hypothetical protein